MRPQGADRTMLYLSPVHQVLRFSGPEALTFLQSQLTNDVAALGVGAWQWQGYCSAKGRLLATFLMARVGDDRWEAIVHSSTVEALAKRLIMFRMRSKAVIEIAVDRRVAWAFAAPDSVASGLSLALPDGRAYVLLDADLAASLATADSATEQRWQGANIEAMLPEITDATVEMFVPQMIGWDTVQPGGGVSFSKGCYPGQEIVARAHYRGAVKRHLEKALLPSTEAPEAGSEILLGDGRSAEVCNVVRNGDSATIALVVASASA